MQTTLLFAALVVGAPAPKDKPNTAEELYGLWELERSESGVEVKARQREGPLRYKYNKDGTWVVLEGDKEVVGPRQFKMDTKASPATIDSNVSAPGGEVVFGIYKIEGDKLTICKARPNQERPTEFAAPTGSTNYLMIFRRVKGKE